MQALIILLGNNFSCHFFLSIYFGETHSMVPSSYIKQIFEFKTELFYVRR